MTKIMRSIGHKDRNFGDLDPLLLTNLRSLSYSRLPKDKQLLNLSVLKLDGSSFEVQVAKNATIAELKQAVVEIFTAPPPKDGEGKISWSDVWGHFCLCYEGQKLINDKVHIRKFGIKDGDQLKFIHHMSISYQPLKSKNIGGTSTSRQFAVFSLRANAHEEADVAGINDNHNFENGYNFKRRHHYEDDKQVLVPKFKLARCFSGHLPYSKWRIPTRKGYLARSHSSGAIQSLLL